MEDRTQSRRSDAPRNQAQGRKCEVNGCYRLVRGSRRLCNYHDTEFQKTGSTTGKRLSLRKNSLKPYLYEVRHFIDHHRDHTGIQEAAKYLDGMLLSAEAPTTLRGRLTARQKAHSDLERLFRDGVTGMAVLETMAAVYYFDQWNPGYLESTRHFDTQLVERVRRIAPLPKRRIPKNGKVTTRLPYASANVVRYLAPKLKSAAGLVCLRIAKRLVELRDEPNIEFERRMPVQGSFDPFE